ncbi:gamma-glutamyltransferase [Kordiimonas sp. SCSIO 12603]|uniref:gamma-glutamyltransferase n=1 Tax=Kordiimonas sp. SCSIO 12603 TaxID=2829596 RepID=UPI0021068653|nr:gamma-glutamyltransferase [Kordiimonas sp. SCSIO 12603]UTW60338.1 gamma-glutamyltransferase [Kordiimonas sp. SCSIO 12603]
MKFLKKGAATIMLAASLAATAADDKPVIDDIGAGGRPVGALWSRSPVYAEHGMAATAHPLASQVAIDILKAGGNAVDAAIAANVAIGLMEPTGNGMGGDLFAIVWDPKTKKLYGLNASGRSPKGRSYDELAARLKGKDTLPPFGDLPVSVPGAVDGWFELHKRFGNKPMSDVLKPAIDYAENGFPVSPVIARYFQMNLARFEERIATINEFDNARATYFKNGAPKAGSLFKNPDLARTFKMLASEGRDAYYKGEIAKTIDAYMKRIGGDLRYEDFANHKSEWVDPACVDYRGHELCELPPNSQGFAALQMANILKNVDLTQWSRGSAEVLHYITEAKRLAFEDLGRFYADPAFSDFDIKSLLTDEYGQKRFALIDPAKVNPNPEPGDPRIEGEGDTTYLTVADKDGMMVSLIQSNYRGMGSGLVPDGLGFMLQDRGQLFSMDPNHPNVYAPGKRPFNTIIPAFVMKDGQPYISFGLMGGGMQPQGHVQVLINIVDYGMNLQEAGDAARLNHIGGREPTGRIGDNSVDLIGTLNLEPGINAKTVAKLKAMGHRVQVIDNGIMFGGYQAIMRDPKTGVYIGATEMRKDGQAIGY